TCGRDKTAKVWDLTTKESVMTYPEHQASVRGVAIRGDGKAGYSAGEDNQLRTWNPAGEPVATGNRAQQKPSIGSHAKPILKLVQHPTMPIMATGAADGSVKTWNTETGKILKVMDDTLGDEAFSVAISPDGNL